MFYSFMYLCLSISDVLSMQCSKCGDFSPATLVFYVTLDRFENMML